MATTAKLMKSPLYIPVDAPDWNIGAASFFALLADPEDDANEKRLQTLDALGSWFGKMYAGQFGSERVDPVFLGMKDRPMYDRIDRSWGRIEKRLIAAELALRVMQRIARRSAPQCGVVIADHLPGEDADIGRFHLIIGPGAEATAGPPARASITSVVEDHARSIVSLRERHRDARALDHPNFAIDSEIPNIFSRTWTPSKPVLHLAIALSTDVEETYPGEARWRKQLCMLANPSWLADCIRRAEVFRTVFAALTPLGIAPDEMIQVLPTRP